MTVLYHSFNRILSNIASLLAPLFSVEASSFPSAHSNIYGAIKVLIVVVAFFAGLWVNRVFRRLVHAAVSAAIGAWMLGESMDLFGLFQFIGTKIGNFENLRHGVTIAFALLGFIVQVFAIKDKEEEDEVKERV